MHEVSNNFGCSNEPVAIFQSLVLLSHLIGSSTWADKTLRQRNSVACVVTLLRTLPGTTQSGLSQIVCKDGWRVSMLQGLLPASGLLATICFGACMSLTTRTQVTMPAGPSSTGTHLPTSQAAPQWTRPCSKEIHFQAAECSVSGNTAWPPAQGN